MSTARGPSQASVSSNSAGSGPPRTQACCWPTWGADVIRVDRLNSPVTDSPIMRRGKRSIELDLRSDADRGTAVALAARVDLVIEGFGGGGMFFVAGLLAALVYARALGRGQVVDSAIVDGAAVLMARTYGRLATGTWTGVRQSRRAVPSRTGSAGVILRGWELITRPGCHQRPGQCEYCRSRSRSWTRPARGSTIRTSATA
jgi:crotonobetainyl-CoA:carnitine CoA-transferase CaiB-like acyl-CoA transferase